IGDMPIGLQMKLLRVLQEGEVRPVGSTQSTSVDVRVLSATHRDLPKRMAEGMFREDLFYRLNVVNLHLPPLSARREDIPVLVTGFLEHLAKARQEPHKIYAPEAMELLVSASWPGNVRHLYNVVEQNVVLSATRVISARVVQDALGGKSDELPSYNDARAEFTRSYLTQLLNITDGNVSQAAKLAKRNRTDFYKLLSRFQIDPAGFKPTRHTVAN
ncbi:MAG: sigma 54-interacting transcriptional regulator, partial [Gammaproteobacteria bacterium]|nr:sigma 54-interacting transcriptional regulator [Gammaproteobacteria bacterium]